MKFPVGPRTSGLSNLTMFYVILLVLFLTPRSSSLWSYFCDLNCGNLPNIVCNLQPCPAHRFCGVEFQSLSYSAKEIDEIVDMHNKLRNRFATGDLTTLENNTFEVANMHAMSYSKELAFVAQCWVNTCNMAGRPKCMKTRRYNVAHSVYIRSIPGDYKPMDVTRQAFDYWVAEKKNFNPEMAALMPITGTTQRVERDLHDLKLTAHFTQIIWAVTTLVGCGRSMFGNDQEQRSVMVLCAYAPAGNVPGKPVFMPGRPCSQCDEEDECNMQYDGLCGGTRPLSKDLWMPPFDLAASQGRWKGNWTWVVGLVFLWMCF